MLGRPRVDRALTQLTLPLTEPQTGEASMGVIICLSEFKLDKSS